MPSTAGGSQQLIESTSVQGRLLNGQIDAANQKDETSNENKFGGAHDSAPI
jgi:hypothetical protein